MSEPSRERRVAEELLKLLGGKWIAAAVAAAAELGIADSLAERPMGAEELADALGCNADSLGRLLGVLTAEGLFETDDHERFQPTALGKQLRADALGPLARFVGAPFSWTPWPRLAETIRTGTAAFELEHGRSLFDHLASHPEESELYNAGVDAFTRHDAQALAAAFDFTDVRTVVDVGGGMGTLIIELLRRWPHLRGILFDKKHVVREAEARLRGAELDSRCACIGGDFFSSVPAGADLYIVRHIIHNWGDDEALTVLENCAAALPPNGKVLVVEGILLPGHRKDTTRLLDLEMMVLSGVGRERTKPQFRRLFNRAGLRLTKTLPLASTARLIIGEPRQARAGM